MASLCIEDVNSRKSVFTEKELTQRTLKYAIGNYGIDDIEKELNKQEKAGVLIKNGDFFTTKVLLDTEKKIIKYTENAIGKSKEILNEQYFEKQCKNFANREVAKDPKFKINDQQKEALKHILTSKDKIILMEGLPGTGKSTILNGVRDISGRKILSFIGFGEKYQGVAPTASAAKSLGKSAKVESDTIHSFLAGYDGYLKDRGKDSLWSMKQEYKNTIIFVDEASLIPTNIMHNLLKLQDKFGYKLVLTGDTKQLGAVEAGKPFEQMLEILPSVKVSEIIRQEDKKHKEAVVASSEGKVKRTFEIHDKNIIQADNPETMAEQAARLYLSGDQNKRDSTLLISPTRLLRDNINNRIVESLRSSNELQGEATNFIALRQKDMTSADYKFAPSFENGDVLKFYKSYKNGIEKGEYFRVNSFHQPSNTLVLTKGHLEDKNNKNQKEIFYQLRKDVDYEKTFEVFTDHPLKLQKGLKILFTKNNRKQGLVNSETAIIEDIGKKSVTVKMEESKQSKTIPLEQLKHIDNGYCITVHSSQGKTYDRVIAAISNNEFLNNLKSWLVTISRHRSELTVFVEDKAKLASQITSNKGIETSAMELVSSKEQSNSKSLQQPIQNDTMKVSKQLEIQI